MLGLEVVCTGLGAGLGGGAGGVVGGARDCEGAGAAVPGAAAGLWWRWCRCGRADGVGLGEGEGDGLAEGVAGAFGAVWPPVAAGAVRANRTAKPTVAIAPSWVARQVSRDRLRSPRDRACPPGPSS
ncbi:MAG TPA: hypothetical protein VFJ07_08520 [Streptosporangiaceae bacterium]|nr:hypothetical protein [Streptosporangiaceae bacterium]